MLTIFTLTNVWVIRNNIKTIFTKAFWSLVYILQYTFYFPVTKRRRSEAVKSFHIRKHLQNAAKFCNFEEGAPTNARSAVYVEGLESCHSVSLFREIHIEVLRLCCLGSNDSVVVIFKHELLQPSLSTFLGVLYSLASLLGLPRLCLHWYLGFGARVRPLFVFRQQGCL